MKPYKKHRKERKLQSIVTYTNEHIASHKKPEINASIRKTNLINLI